MENNEQTTTPEETVAGEGQVQPQVDALERLGFVETVVDDPSVIFNQPEESTEETPEEALSRAR